MLSAAANIATKGFHCTLNVLVKAITNIQSAVDVKNDLYMKEVKCAWIVQIKISIILFKIK